MEIKNNHSLRNFEIIDKGVYYHISSPKLDKGLKTFKEKRQFYRLFKKFEKKLTKSWTARTNISNPVMIKIFTKLGMTPWYVDVKKEKIYFFKDKFHEGL